MLAISPLCQKLSAVPAGCQSVPEGLPPGLFWVGCAAGHGPPDPLFSAGSKWNIRLAPAVLHQGSRTLQSAVFPSSSKGAVAPASEPSLCWGWGRLSRTQRRPAGWCRGSSGPSSPPPRGAIVSEGRNQCPRSVPLVAVCSYSPRAVPVFSL